MTVVEYKTKSLFKLLVTSCFKDILVYIVKFLFFIFLMDAAYSGNYQGTAS